MSTIPVRFVCISNTFGETFELPAGDVLIHAGNLTRNGTQEELEHTVSWLDQANFSMKLIVAGDHDRCLDLNGCQSPCPGLEKQAHHANHRCPPSLEKAASLVFLSHEPQVITCHTAAGQTIRFRVFGSPFAPTRGVSAFGYEIDEAFGLWSEIPLDTDVRGFAGCRTLRETLWRVRPRLFVCGREYAGRGVEVVKWQLDNEVVKYKEDHTYHLKHATSLHTQQRYNLSSSSCRPLLNDGASGALVPLFRPDRPRPSEYTAKVHEHASLSPTDTSCKWSLTHGVGGINPSGLASICDHEAIIGREGRLETAIVNAAILPIDRTAALQGAHRRNKAIVIDIDLPLAQPRDAWYMKEAIQLGKRVQGRRKK